MEKKMGTTMVNRGNIGILEQTIETIIVHRGNIGIMDEHGN